MAVFSSSTSATGQTNDRPELSFVNEKGTEELRSYVRNNITSNGVDIDRIVRYELFWKFYKGEHWRLYNDTFLSMNYIKAFINKVNSFLLGPKGFSFVVKNELDNGVDEEIETAGEAIINYIWAKNKKVERQYEIFQMGGVTGDAWMHLQWKEDPIFKGNMFLVIDCLDSRQCFPQFQDGDISKLIGFEMRIPLATNEFKFRLLCVYYTVDRYVTWYQKDTTNTPSTTRYNERDNPNPYGFIPVVHVKNRPNSESYYGISDAHDILKLNKIYNEQAQSIKEIEDYYRAPTTVITGGTAKSLSKGIGRVWSGLPAEANVFNLSLGEDRNSSLTFLNVIKIAMHELSDVPENALGKLQPISNTSAAALQVTYQPLIQQADYKAITYSEGFITLHKMAIKILRIVAPNKSRIASLLAALPEGFEDEYTVGPVFTYGLPQDVMAALQQADYMIRLRLNSKKNIMNDLGVRNVPQVVAEINEENLADADVQSQINTKLGIAEDPETGANGGAKQGN